MPCYGQGYRPSHFPCLLSHCPLSVLSTFLIILHALARVMGANPGQQVTSIGGWGTWLTTKQRSKCRASNSDFPQASIQTFILHDPKQRELPSHGRISMSSFSSSSHGCSSSSIQTMPTLPGHGSPNHKQCLSSLSSLNLVLCNWPCSTMHYSYLANMLTCCTGHCILTYTTKFSKKKKKRKTFLLISSFPRSKQYMPIQRIYKRANMSF